MSDIVTEGFDEGIDTVCNWVSLTLSANIEILQFLGSEDINGTGNQLNNTIIGNDGDNRLDGGTGTDTLQGGLGSDTYVVNTSSDIVIEDVDAGEDTVISSAFYVMSANVEILVLTGQAASGVGNELGNTITGNGADNVLEGQAGNDTLNGAGGTDLLDGGDGYDTLIGGSGSDRLTGGLGDDIYEVDNALDIVAEAADAGFDTVQAKINYTLGANVEALQLLGTASISGTGNEDDNTIEGNAGANTIDGGAGADFIAGGLGNDIYVVDDVGELLFRGKWPRL